jgi:RimJ/RimL family protein N-acetyltransferase
MTDEHRRRPPTEDDDVTDIAFIPDVVLEGQQVRLRPFEERDLNLAWDMLNEPEGRRLTGTHATFTREAADRWYRSRGEDDDRLDLVVASRHDDRLVGEAVLNDLDGDNHSCAFRISLAGPSVFGRGYGTEATKLIIDHAFQIGIHRVSLQVFDFNTRAQRVYEKAGFTVEGVLRDALYWDGAYHDAVLMAILADDNATARPAID